MPNYPTTGNRAGMLPSLSLNTAKPLTLGISWAAIFVLSIGVIVIFSYFLSRTHSPRDWRYYLVIVVAAMSACGSAYGCLKAWKIHRAQTSASLPR
ncbi:hypothetical protein C8J57DRAFT_1314266 [Mycena rebaudengoi]|nr:hypothetical protein C8J57DRAFT_1314266 [Mycena rebaudengoi]